MGLTRLSLARPVAIVMLFAALVVLGLQSYGRLAVDRLPPTNFPSVSVNVNYAGASPRDIETLIAIPLEKAVAGLRGVDSVSSTSSLGSARLNINFTEDTNLDQAAIDVEKRLAAVRNQLPADASAPSVVKADFGSFPIMNIVMSGGGRLTTAQLYDLGIEQVQPQLLQVDGVADVSISGGRQREIQVRVDPVRLKAFDISLQQVVTSLGSENVNAPSGTLRVGNAEPNVRFTALAQSVADLKNIVVQRGGGGAGGSVVPAVYVKDIADVVDTYAEQSRLQRFNGEEAVGITVTKQPDSNSIKVADGARAAIERVQRSAPQGVSFRIANDTTKYTREALNDVQVDLELAIIITGAVLMVFLHSWRNTIIVLLAIPTSLISTFLVMYFIGFTLNLMSLLALALLIGILVDDSIVVLENIHRHLGLGATPMVAALRGRSEIGLAAIAITLLDVVVFAPIAFVNGNIGSLFRQFGLTIAIATLFSLLICFTLTPMLASRWLKEHERDGDDEGTVAAFTGGFTAMAAGIYGALAFQGDRFAGQTVPVPAWITNFINSATGVQATAGGGFGAAPGAAAPGQTLAVGGLVALGIGIALFPVGWFVLRPIARMVMRVFPRVWDTGYGVIARGYGAILPGVIRLRFLVVLAGMGMLWGTVAMVQGNFVGSEYAPLEDENQISMSLRMPPGATLEATDRVTQQVESIVMDKNRFPEVKSVFTSVGGGGGGYGGGGGRSSNLAIELVDRGTRSRTVWDIQTELRSLGAGLPDVTVGTSLPAALGGGGGGGGNVSVRILGPDPEVLGRIADQYEALLRRTPGIAEVSNSGQSGVPELRATVRRSQASDLAVTSTTVSQAMRTAIQGTVATQLRVQDQAQADVRVLVGRDQSGTPLNIEDVPILTTRGVLVRLGQVATIESATGPSQINRSDRNRSVSVSGPVVGRPLSEVAAEVRQGQASIPLPAGYRATVGGAVQQLDRAITALSGALGLSLVLMYILMAALYNSYLSPFIVLASLPLAMVGAFGGLYLLDKTLNIFSLIGIIMLTGLVSKNAILLVDYANTLRSEEGLSARDALVRAGPIRLRPILMTSATLVCSMLPILLGTGPGAESRSPVAAVITGGMITSTLLTLIFVPALYTYFDDLANLPGRFMAWRARRRPSVASVTAGETVEDGQPAGVAGHEGAGAGMSASVAKVAVAGSADNGD
ncbi:MAG: efflux RND transporter permease subunit [Chloroflexi bacterium]|nr:MAG: efflux RND transporter permease subunit [Chloroflexota bacterium]